MKTALWVLMIVALVVVLVGALNHGTAVSFDYVAGSTPAVSLFWLALGAAAALVLAGIAGWAVAVASAYATRRKLEKELEATYRRLRDCEARLAQPASPPAAEVATVVAPAPAGEAVTAVAPAPADEAVTVAASRQPTRQSPPSHLRRPTRRSPRSRPRRSMRRSLRSSRHRSTKARPATPRPRPDARAASAGRPHLSSPRGTLTLVMQP